MLASELLQEIASRGLTCKPEGNGIRVEGPAVALTDDLRAAIRLHKPQLLALLQPRAKAAPEPGLTREAVEAALAGRRPCPCGWHCYAEPDREPWTLALPCIVVRGEKTLEQYAAECYPDDAAAQSALLGMYSEAHRIYTAAKMLGMLPKPKVVMFSKARKGAAGA